MTKFKTPEELGVTPDVFCKIMTTAALLQDGSVKHIDATEMIDAIDSGKHFGDRFNMGTWDTSKSKFSAGCGTVCCIGGWSGLNPLSVLQGRYGRGVRELCYPPGARKWNDITPDMAARAIINWATTGNPQWYKIR